MHQKDLLPFSFPCDKFKFITLEPNLWKYYDFKSIRLVTNVINSIWLSLYDLLWSLINVIERNRYDCYHLSPSRKSAAFFNPNNIRIVPSKKLPQARGKQDNGKQGNGKQARGKQGNGTLNSAQTK